MKYRRLLRMMLKMGLLCAVCGFVLRYLWDYGFSTEGMTQEVLTMRGVEALQKGMLFGGLYISFPMWLALERFRRPEQKTKAEGHSLDNA